jgi:nitrous oxidase accessory protein
VIRGLALLWAGALAAAGPARAQPVDVGPGGAHASIVAALAAAAPGDTVRVGPGVYRERLRITKPVTLVGEGWPVIDGGGEGHVVESTAPLDLRGFVLRGSGSSAEKEDAGVMVRGAPATIVGNRLEDVLYGIYVKQGGGSTVARNRVVGKPFSLARRGDGIRLWYSPGSRVADNEVHGARDVVFYFSDRLLIEGNEIADGRYGLHYMYSNDSRIVGNRLLANQVGAFLMYSSGLELRDNVFSDAEGTTGMGMGLKDSDAVVVRDNLFLENEIGVHLDNAPRSRDRTNEFTGNTFALNGAAVRLMPSVTGNRFHGNDFLANDAPVRVAGGARPGQVEQNDWSGNHWSAYAGFDRDGDGVGDTPYVHARLGDQLLERHPELRIFARSPALAALDGLARFFPLLRPAPVVADPLPRLSLQAAPRWANLGPSRPIRRGMRGGAAWLLIGIGAVVALRIAADTPRHRS